MPLNYTNSVPLHLQLKAIIENKVRNQEYTGRIPSERELIDEFYVSRSTVRQAINQLVRDGILKKVPGKGTYVVFKPIQDWLGNLSSTNETIERMGMSPGAKLIEVKTLTLGEPLKKIIGLEEVYCFKRIRYANVNAKLE